MRRRETRAQIRDARERIARNSRYKLRLSDSRIHRRGVFAAENIPARRRVIEYAGKKLNRMQTRAKYLRGWGQADRTLNYLAQLDSYWAIDGYDGGSGAELVNHSCEPNCGLGRFKGRLWIVSLRRIRAGEELAYDYAFAKTTDIIPCRCGSKKCRGTINVK